MLLLVLRRPAVIAALLLLCAGAPARAGEDLPFVGLGPLDPQSAHDLDAGALEQLAGAGTTLACTTLARTMLARTMPVAWGAIEPAAPIGAEPVYAWPVLDRAVLLWQLAGLDPVLVLSPASPWASLPVADAPLVERVRKVLPAVEAEAALQDLTGAAPPRADRWGAWERFVRAVVERYDFDGADDMPGLRRAVRYVQPLAGIDGAAWLGDEAATLRVLHHALEGARAASATCRVLGPVVDLRATGHAPHPDAREWAYRIGQATPARTRPFARMEVERHFALAARLLDMPRLFDVFCHAGSAHAADDVANLRFVRRMLDAAGGGPRGVWLVGGPTHKLGDAQAPGAVMPKLEERRLRQRWESAARQPRHPDHAVADAWLRRGEAYDLVRTLGRARAAGADAVLAWSAFDGRAPDPARFADRRGLLRARTDEAGDRSWERTPSWWALQQALQHLGDHRTAGESPIGAPGWSVIFHSERELERPWVAVLMLDARLSWAGDPGHELPLQDVLVTLPSGAYTLEWIRTGPEAPRTLEVVSDGSITVRLGPEPVYVLPKR